MTDPKPKPPPVPPAAVQFKWEYKVVVTDLKYTANTETQLNELGRNGWEAVGIIPEGARTVVLVKRRVKR